MKRCSTKLYRSDEQEVWTDVSISHSRYIKLGHAQTVLRVAGQPSNHRTQQHLVRIDDSEIPQEFYVDNAFFDAELRETVQRKVPAKRYTNSVRVVLVSPSLNDYTFLQDQPMLKWMGTGGKPGFCQEFLLELLWWKGHGDNYIFQVCPQCSMGMATYRCDGCSRELMICEGCCLTNHANLPLHTIEVCLPHLCDNS